MLRLAKWFCYRMAALPYGMPYGTGVFAGCFTYLRTNVVKHDVMIDERCKITGDFG